VPSWSLGDWCTSGAPDSWGRSGTWPSREVAPAGEGSSLASWDWLRCIPGHSGAPEGARSGWAAAPGPPSAGSRDLLRYTCGMPPKRDTTVAAIPCTLLCPPVPARRWRAPQRTPRRPWYTTGSGSSSPCLRGSLLLGPAGAGAARVPGPSSGTPEAARRLPRGWPTGAGPRGRESRATGSRAEPRP